MPRNYNHTRLDPRKFQRTELVYNKQFIVKRRALRYKTVLLFLIAFTLCVLVLFPEILQFL